MPIEQIRTLAVVLSDAKKAKEWYKGKLGFVVQADIENPVHPWIVVSLVGSRTGIHLCQTNAHIPLEPGNTGIVLVATDIEGTCRELKQKGVEFARDLAKAEWNEDLKYALFKDPDGNEFWLMPKE